MQIIRNKRKENNKKEEKFQPLKMFALFWGEKKIYCICW